MKKKQSKIKFLLNLCPLFILILICFLGIGYAHVNYISLEIHGDTVATVINYLTIEKVEYVNREGKLPNEQISEVMYDKTMLNTTINLEPNDESSEVSLKVTLFNGGDKPYTFSGITYASNLVPDLPNIYSNYNIEYTYDNSLSVIEKYGGRLEVTITFKYKTDADTSQNTLTSTLNFEVLEETVYDLSGNNRHGNAYNLTKNEEGSYFNGQSSYITLPDDMNMTYPATYSVKVKFNKNTRQIIFGNNETGAALGLITATQIILNAGDAGSCEVEVYNIPAIQIDTEYNFDVTYNTKDDFELYINGIKQNKSTSKNCWYWYYPVSTIGKRGTNSATESKNDFFYGTMYRFMVYDTILSSEQINQNLTATEPAELYQEHLQQYFEMADYENVYKISLLDSDDSVIKKIFYKYQTSKIIADTEYKYFANKNLTMPLISVEIPQKVGYIFNGYYSEENGQGVKYIDENGNIVTELFDKAYDRNLYAHWTPIYYRVSYDYTLDLKHQTFNVGYANNMVTGYLPDWDRSFKIEMTVSFPTSSKRYLLIGGYDGVNSTLNVEIYKNDGYRVWVGSKSNNPTFDKSFGTMYVNEDINVVYEWDHINRTQIMTASGTQTNIYQTYPLSESDASGITKKILKIGNADYREKSPFSDLEIKRLVITQYQTYNSAFDNLSVVDEDLVFDGWYTNKTTGVKLENTSTQPASDITYYARWTQ